jgi:hypothetical protein
MGVERYEDSFGAWQFSSRHKTVGRERSGEWLAYGMLRMSACVAKS